MIKVEIKDKGKEESEYPKLMEGKRTGVIVLFIANEVGTIVSGVSRNGRTIGSYYEGWAMGRFTDYHGTVTLSNG